MPQSFVLKTNHDGGGVVLVPDKDAFLADSKTFKQAMKKLNKHLNTNYYTMYREWHYKDIEPRVFAEELLGVESSTQTNLDSQKFENGGFHKFSNNLKPADTYKFHIFGNDDINNYIQVTTDRFDNYQRAIMDCHWQKAPFGFVYDNSEITKLPKKPKDLAMMYKVSHILALPFAYVRVDLYDVYDSVYVGELTFTHGGGSEVLNPKEWDKKLGALWHSMSGN